MVNKKMFYIVVPAMLLGFLSGCAKKYSYDSFNPQDIDRIVILPFMDNRQDANPKHNFVAMTNLGSNHMSCGLKFGKKYRTALSSDIGTVSSYSILDLPSYDPETNSVDSGSVDPEWVKQLGPPTSQWVFVPVLEDLTDYDHLIISGGEAKVSGYLFNKKTGKFYFRTQASHGMGAGILGDAIMQKRYDEKHVFEMIAVGTASLRCVELFPERPEPYLLPD